MPKISIKLENILGGIAPTQYFGPKGSFNSSIAIDPDLPVGSGPKTSGMIVPVGYAKFSGANVNASVIALITNPKNTLTYAVLNNGRLISYDSAMANEALVGTVTGSNAEGGFYYNNYVYITGTGASKDDMSRYGPLDGSPTLVDNVWKGSTLGTQTALTNTTYPTLRSVRLPNHWGFAHKGDGCAYVVDFKNGQGWIHRISTKKVTAEGDTNDTTVPSAYGALDLPFGFYPVAGCSFNNDLAIIAIQTIDTTIDQGEAAMFLWDVSDSSSFYKGPIPLGDSLATAILNVNGIPVIFSGNASSGIRISRYIGGESVSEVAFQEEGTPPFPGAAAIRGNRIAYGNWTTVPTVTASVCALNSKTARLSGNPAAIQNIAKGSGAGTTPIVTAIKFTQQASSVFNKLIIASTDGTGTQIDQYSSSATLASVFRWTVNAGRKFNVSKIRLALGKVVAANMSIVPKLLFDEESSSKTLATINNTNYSGKRKVIYENTELTGAAGENSFILELSFTGTVVLPVLLPILIDLDVVENE
jgi:hypothetical protein